MPDRNDVCQVVLELRERAARLEREYGIPTPPYEPFSPIEMPRELAVLNWRLRVIDAAGKTRAAKG